MSSASRTGVARRLQPARRRVARERIGLPRADVRRLGTVGILVRRLDLPAESIAGFRLAFAAAARGPRGAAAPGRALPRGGELGRLGLLGVLTAVNWWAFILAFRLTDIGITVVLSFTWPVWYAVFGRLLGFERRDGAKLAALAVSLVGLALLVGRTGAPPDARDVLGMLTALGTAVSMAFMVLVSRSLPGGMPSATVNFWQSGIAAVLLAPFAVAGAGRGTLDAPAWIILFFLGAVLTGLGGTLFVTGLRVLSPIEAGVVSYLEPVSAVLLAAWLVDEVPGPRGPVGDGAARERRPVGRGPRAHRPAAR